MSLTQVQVASANLTSSAVQLTLGTLSGAQTGDLIIAFCSAERSLIPDIAGGTSSWTIVRTESSTNHALQIAWKWVHASETAITITGNVSATRRMAGGFIVLREVTQPVFTNKAFVSAVSTPFVAPNVTPSVDDSWLLSIFSSASPTVPYIRTYDARSTGYTELIDQSSGSTTSGNTFVSMAKKQLTGGSGVSQAGDSVTPSSSSEYRATTVVVATGPVMIPTEAGLDQTNIEPWTTVTLSGSGTGSWSQTAGTPTVTLVGSGGTVTFTAPPSLTGCILTFTYGDDSMNVTVLPATDAIYTSGQWVPVRLRIKANL